MKTEFLIMVPDEPHETREVELPLRPTYDQLRAVLDPIFLDDWEHVTVLADPRGGLKFRRSDMFVDENGKRKRLAVNYAATIIYHRAAILAAWARGISIKPDTLNVIVGPAVLFRRIVWT